MVLRSHPFRRLFQNIAWSLKNPPRQFNFSLSFLLSVLLFVLEFFVSHYTNSLLLFGASLAQLSFSIFIGYLYFFEFGGISYESVQGRLAITLLNGFLLLLLTGYIFLETYLRFSHPLNISSRLALATALVSMIGNFFVIRILIRSRISRWKFGSFHLPVHGILILFFTVLSGIALIHITQLDFLDTVAALLMGITLFTWAGFIVMDAYWKILEIE